MVMKYANMVQGIQQILVMGYIMCEEFNPESNKYVCEVIDNGKVEETTCYHNG